MSSDGTERICLDLFAGLGGFSAAFDDSPDWEVVTVDLEERFDPDIQADIMDLRPGDLPNADVVLASPPCTELSLAASRYEKIVDGEPQTDAARDAIALVYHAIGLIKALSPEYWMLENPQGYLREFLGTPTGHVTYCQYGEPYMKPTDLWGDHPPGLSYRSCSRGDGCHASNRDHENGDWSSMDVAGYSRDPAERAKIPRELSEDIFQAVEGQINYKQATLLSPSGGRNARSLQPATQQDGGSP